MSHRQPGIGSRIRALRVHPPVAESQLQPAGALSYLKTTIFHWKYNAPHEKNRDPLVRAMHHAIIHCKNVEDLDLYYETGFRRSDIPSPLFLQDMWDTMGQNLRKLKVECPSEKFGLLLDASATVTNLEELKITIPLIRSLDSIHQSTSAIVTSRPLIAFVQTQRYSLRSLVLTSFEFLNLTSYINEFGYFPCLNQLKITLTFNHITLPIPSTLTRFLDMHKATLQTIDIQRNYKGTDTTYSTWISQELPTLEFPVLQTLRIGIWICQFPYVPQLRVLDIFIRHRDSIPEMIDGLHRSSGRSKVKEVIHRSKTSLRIKLSTPHLQTA